MFLFLKYNRAFIFVILMLIAGCVLAATKEAAPPSVEGLSIVADNLMMPVSLLSKFVHSACVIIGASFLFASVIKYMEHRRSPLMVSISTVIFLFVAGIVLMLLPLIATVTESGGVHYRVFTR